MARSPPSACGAALMLALAVAACSRSPSGQPATAHEAPEAGKALVNPIDTVRDPSADRLFVVARGPLDPHLGVPYAPERSRSSTALALPAGRCGWAWIRPR